MKKTIASLAILVSSNGAFALPEPPNPNAPRPVIQTVCLKPFQIDDGSQFAGCDEAQNNIDEKRELKKNGCAEGQVAIRHTGKVSIESCMPPGMAQL